MNVELRTLRADIAADLKMAAGIYTVLDSYRERLTEEEDLIVVGYYLHNLYCAFESIFQHIAGIFGNQVSDQAGWHADLLRRMTLDIEGLRPRLLSEAAYESLDELRRFRHLFRSAYRMHLDADRLSLVYKKAQSLNQVYRVDMERFQAFLDDLLRQGEE